MCRKFETEEEKVLPFYASSLTQEEQSDVNTAMLEAPNEALVAVSVEEIIICLPLICKFLFLMVNLIFAIYYLWAW
jgi:hypothetical protein